MAVEQTQSVEEFRAKTDKSLEREREKTDDYVEKIQEVARKNQRDDRIKSGFDIDEHLESQRAETGLEHVHHQLTQGRVHS
jgi:hypothetical protein